MKKTTMFIMILIFGAFLFGLGIDLKMTTIAAPGVALTLTGIVGGIWYIDE